MAAKESWDMKRMGRRMAAWRTTRGWSQQQLADRSKVSRGSIQALEAGTSSKDGPGLNTLFRLLDALGITPREFFATPESSDYKLPFAYDPDFERFYKLLAEITSSDRPEVQSGILSNLISHAGTAKHSPDPLTEEQKTLWRTMMQQLLRYLDSLDGAPPSSPASAEKQTGT